MLSLFYFQLQNSYILLPGTKRMHHYIKWMFSSPGKILTAHNLIAEPQFKNTKDRAFLQNRSSQQEVDATHLCRWADWSGRWWASPPGPPPSPLASGHTWKAARRWFAWTLPPAPPALPSGWCRWRRTGQGHPVHKTGPHGWRFSKPSGTKKTINNNMQKPVRIGQICWNPSKDV